MTAENRPRPAGPTRDASPPPEAAAEQNGHRPPDEPAEGAADVSADPLKESPLTIVDMLSFAHLLNAAQQSGLVPNADAIAWRGIATSAPGDISGRST